MLQIMDLYKYSTCFKTILLFAIGVCSGLGPKINVFGFRKEKTWYSSEEYYWNDHLFYQKGIDQNFVKLWKPNQNSLKNKTFSQLKKCWKTLIWPSLSLYLKFYFIWKWCEEPFTDFRFKQNKSWAQQVSLIFHNNNDPAESITYSINY